MLIKIGSFTCLLAQEHTGEGHVVRRAGGPTSKSRKQYFRRWLYLSLNNLQFIETMIENIIKMRTLSSLGW